MKEIFADTSGWAHFFVRTEPLHLEAKKEMHYWYENGVKLVTTNYVLIELVVLMTSPLHIPKVEQIRIDDTLKKASWVEIIRVDTDLDDESWAFFKARQDKFWSLVDCTSFVVMHQRNIVEAFTSDHHFEQAGFLRTLK